MSQQSLLLALGSQGYTLTCPAGVLVSAPRPVQPEPAEDPAHPRPRPGELVRAALAQPVAGPPLSALAVGKRRVAILVTDIGHPALYPRALAETGRVLVEAGIRPARITFLCVPGCCGPVLGTRAIRRYGEEVVGEYELRDWGAAPEAALAWDDTGAEEDETSDDADEVNADGDGPDGDEADGGDVPEAAAGSTVAPRAAETDPAYDAADLRLAVLPAYVAAGEALPGRQLPDLALVLAPGRDVFPRYAAALAGPPVELWTRLAQSGGETHAAPPSAAVRLVTGGGAPSDATLEEALAALRWLGAPGAAGHAGTLVLAFGGEAGLGSARFTLALWDWLEAGSWRAAVEPRGVAPGATVAASAELPPWGRGWRFPWTPLDGLAAALAEWPRVVLFSPGLAAHEEGEDLRERLDAQPNLAARLLMVGQEAELWPELQRLNGGTYGLLAEPLGWRALTPPAENTR